MRKTPFVPDSPALLMAAVTLNPMNLAVAPVRGEEAATVSEADLTYKMELKTLKPERPTP